MMKNVFAMAAMAAFAAHGAWTIGSIEILTDKSAEGSNADGNRVLVHDVREDGEPATNRFVAVFRGLVSANGDDTFERTCTFDYVRRAPEVDISMAVGYMKSWRVGVGTDYESAKANICAAAVRIGGEWRYVGGSAPASAPVLGIDGSRRLTVEIDPAAGSTIEVLGSTDLKTWVPATASSKFFKAVQKEVR